MTHDLIPQATQADSPIGKFTKNRGVDAPSCQAVTRRDGITGEMAWWMFKDSASFQLDHVTFTDMPDAGYFFLVRQFDIGKVSGNPKIAENSMQIRELP